MDRKRYHVTVIDRAKGSAVIDTDTDAIVGVLKSEDDNSVSRFVYAEVDNEELIKLIIAMVRETAHISDNLTEERLIK